MISQRSRPAIAEPVRHGAREIIGVARARAPGLRRRSSPRPGRGPRRRPLRRRAAACPSRCRRPARRSRAGSPCAGRAGARRPAGATRRPRRARPAPSLRVEDLRRARRIHREELGEPHRQAVQHFLERGDRGLTRPCSIREIMPFVTPARFASSRWDRPCIWRTAFSRAPTSLPMGTPVVYDIKHAVRVISRFHSKLSIIMTAVRHRPRSVLDAVHREPPVQGEAAPARARRGHVLLDAGRPPGPRRRGGPVVRQRRPRPPGDHRGGRAADRDDGLRPALPDGPPARLRARERAGRDRARRASITCSSRTRARSPWTPRSRSRSPTTACAAKARARA